MILWLLQIVYVVLVVLLLFNLTIFIHELGHYMVGRWRGAKIERFAVWFGPALWSKTIRGVEWRLGCIPLGGYVAFPQLAMEAIEGKSETPAEKLEPLKPRDKIPILLAGSIANFFLAIVVACIVWVVGLPKDKSDFDLKIGYVLPNSPERTAGIQAGDEIVSINGKPVKDWDEIRYRVALSLTKEVVVAIKRNGLLQQMQVVPGHDKIFGMRMLSLEHSHVPIASKCFRNSPAEKAGIQPGDELIKVESEKILGGSHFVELIGTRANKPTQLTILRKGKEMVIEIIPKMERKSKMALIGLYLDKKRDSEVITVNPSPLQEITKSLFMMVDTLNALLHSRTTGVGFHDLAGPMGIGAHLYRSIDLDFRLGLDFLVILNINLAIINLLPIPVLDGGHIVFSLIEAVRRRPINQKFMEVTQTVFIVLLLTFMAYITFNDIKRESRFGIFSHFGKNSEESSVQEFEEMPE